MSRAYRATVIALGLMFVGFAALQLNDSDPLLWVAVYGLAAGMCGASASGRLPWAVATAAALVAVLGALPLLPAAMSATPAGIVSDMGMYGAGVEEAREVMGLLVVAGCLGGIAVAERRRAPRAERPLPPEGAAR